MKIILKDDRMLSVKSERQGKQGLKGNRKTGGK